MSPEPGRHTWNKERSQMEKVKIGRPISLTETAILISVFIVIY